MARRFLTADVKVSDGLTDMAGKLKRNEGRFLTRVAERERDEIAAKAPGGPAGSIGSSFRAVPAANGVSYVRSDHPGADALDRGAWITPAGLRQLGEEDLRHQKRRLRFEVEGRVVFVPFVRLKARGYVRKALRSRRRVINEAFGETHGTPGP